MRAIGYHHSLPISDPASLLDLELPDPLAGERELLVRVRAVSVNPIDTKIRRRRSGSPAAPVVLGWDACGVVEAVGPGCRLFQPGERVFYSGSVDRPGCDSELHVVDERLVGHAPAAFDDQDAAALPLTAITAWEALFDRLRIPRNRAVQAGRLLIIGGAGGVGSIAIQLAALLTGCEVIATASRPEGHDWCRGMGARLVVDHRGDLVAQLAAHDITQVEHVLLLNATDQHFPTVARLIAPHGHICAITDSAQPLDMNLLKPKSASFSWEFMSTRPMHRTADMQCHHDILEDVAHLADAGRLRRTTGTRLGPITAANLRRAHQRLENGITIGKLVLSGWPPAG